MRTILDYLKNKQLIWQANQHQAGLPLCSTGFSELDTALQGGFPEHGVIDIDSPVGIGELRLLLPNLQIRQQSREKLLVFIAPPMQINSELLASLNFSLSQVLVISPTSAAQALWSAEQCLKSGCCHSVLLWHSDLEIHQVKRLQLAAEQGDALHILMRRQLTQSLSLPVSLAMRLTPCPNGLGVEITKRKGSWPGQAFSVDMRPYWPQLAVKSMPDNVIPLHHSKVS